MLLVFKSLPQELLSYLSWNMSNLQCPDGDGGYWNIQPSESALKFTVIENRKRSVDLIPHREPQGLGSLPS